jgi:hypothetical protein
MAMFKVLPRIFVQSEEQQTAALERKLIKQEAVLGGKLFGPLPKDHHREFFCLDQRTWVWHEEWNENGQRKVVTTRYIVRPNGFLKQQGNRAYEYISKEEAHNLYRAIELYSDRVNAEYHRLLHAA